MDSKASLMVPPSFCEEELQGRVSKLKECLVLLHEMGDSHLEAIPFLPNVILTCPPSHVSQACWNDDWPIGQPRRENPSQVTGTSGGSGE